MSRVFRGARIGFQNRGENRLPEYRKEIARLRPFKRPGVVAHSGSDDISKKFDVDLRGWKYGEHLKKRVDERATELFRGEAGERMKAFNPAMYQEMMEGAARYWDSIHVVLAEKPVNKERAHWVDARRLLRVVLPKGAAPYQLRDLEQTLKHELRHFSQGYLTYAVGYAQERFLDRKPSPGLPSRHIMTPDIRQDREAPASLMQQLKDRLRAENTPWHIERVILRNPKIDLHALDDVEFYTRLADSIVEFEGMVKRAPRMTRDQKANMVRLFTGAIPNPKGGHQMERIKELGGYEIVKWFEPSRFFTTLLKYGRGKWKKAVGEFVKVAL